MPRSVLRAIGSRTRSKRGTGLPGVSDRRTGGAPGTSGVAPRDVTTGRRRTFERGWPGRLAPPLSVTGSAPAVAAEDPPQADEHQHAQGNAARRPDDRGLGGEPDRQRGAGGLVVARGEADVVVTGDRI